MRVLLISLALLLIPAAALAHSGPASPEASGHADSDGRVPLFYVCKPGEDWLGEHSQWLIERDGKSDSYRSQIRINYCRLIRDGGGPNDLRRVIAHERAHSRGWEHGDGTPETNPAYYSGTKLHGT